MFGACFGQALDVGLLRKKGQCVVTRRLAIMALGLGLAELAFSRKTRSSEILLSPDFQMSAGVETCESETQVGGHGTWFGFRRVSWADFVWRVGFHVAGHGC